MNLSDLTEANDPREAMRTLDHLYKQHGEEIPSELIFKQDWRYENPTVSTAPTASQWHPRHVAIGNLHFLQETVEYSYLKQYIEGNGRSGKDPIRVVEYPDKSLNVIDGHHRVAAAILLGRHGIQALVASIKASKIDANGELSVEWK